jgi:hypothetical protein
MLAKRVKRPIRINAPQSISKKPTKLPKNSGDGKPILANLPAPKVSGNKNFCIPSEKNTAPTNKRTKIVVFELSVCINFCNIIIFLFENPD